MNRLICFLFGHRLDVLQYFGKEACRVVCRRCLGDWAVHKAINVLRKGQQDTVRVVVPWDGEFAEMYELFGYRIRQWPPARAAERTGGGR